MHACHEKRGESQSKAKQSKAKQIYKVRSEAERDEGLEPDGARGEVRRRVGIYVLTYLLTYLPTYLPTSIDSVASNEFPLVVIG